MPRVEELTIERSRYEPEVLIGQLNLEVPGLKPEIRTDDGKVICQSNLDELMDKTDEALNKKPWYKPLLRDVLEDKKSAVFIVSSIGVLTIFAATVAGFEFGIRHGKDLKHLSEMLDRRKAQQPPK